MMYSAAGPKRGVLKRIERPFDVSEHPASQGRLDIQGDDQFGGQSAGGRQPAEPGSHASLPNLKWVSTVTYISITEAWLALDVLLDLRLRKDVG